MRKLMISVHPQWVQKILNGDKTIEVRPWIPKGELPLEVLIYVTKGEPYLAEEKINHDDTWEVSQTFLGYSLFDTKYELDFRDEYYVKNCPPLNGKVVASFILNKVEEIIMRKICGEWEVYGSENGQDSLIQKSCLTQKEIFRYLKGNNGYAWHIDDLKIFEEPKELGDYGLTKAPQKMVWVE